MKTQLVYVLTSTEYDIYLEQAYVSMFSAKYYMPDSHIILITDHYTAKSFTGIRKDEIKYIDEVIEIDLDSERYNGQQRSRLLKTNVRNLIDGDFLFIDCDTIITKPLYEIDSIEYEIAACRDTHSLFIKNPYRDMCIRDANKIGWDISEEEEYFNSGVIYCKDTSLTRSFYKLWHNHWVNNLSKGVSMDQPTFAFANAQMGHIIKVLPDVWNCELKHGIKFLKDAFIVHYLCTNPSHYQDKQLFILNEKDVLLAIKKDGVIVDEVKKTIDDPFYGLASPTHCFAGDDLSFFRSRQYQLLSKDYHRNKNSIIQKMISFILRFNNKFLSD